ncbi:MAG: hypothetical protein IKU19_02540 [Clostridia bacterium]|nr:hypothetical protein [Clostridia bacterium]
MKKGITRGILYAFVHFSLEVACFYFLFNRFGADSRWILFALLYDCLAFVPQGIFGALQDRFKKLDLGTCGAIMVITALILPFDIIGFLLICFGNALVHISGAHYTLRDVAGKLSPSGIFVGGGSFGVIVGQLLSKTRLVIIPLALMTLSVIIICFINHRVSLSDKAEGFDMANKSMPIWIFVLLLFTAVAVRAYIGYAIPIAWKSTALDAVILFFVMGIGKMLGGIFSDIIGTKKTAIFSLILSLPFMLFGNTNMLISVIGVGLFSMTMAITLGALVSRMEDNPGVAFGITTLGLFIGTVPAFFVLPRTLIANQVTVAVLTVAVIIIFIFSLKGDRKNVKPSAYGRSCRALPCQ